MSFKKFLSGTTCTLTMKKQKNLSWNDVWYIGNDVNDLGAIERANLSICPADAVKKVRKSVTVVLKTKGGYGILSEIATLLEQ